MRSGCRCGHGCGCGCGAVRRCRGCGWRHAGKRRRTGVPQIHPFHPNLPMRTTQSQVPVPVPKCPEELQIASTPRAGNNAHPGFASDRASRRDEQQIFSTSWESRASSAAHPAVRASLPGFKARKAWVFASCPPAGKTTPPPGMSFSLPVLSCPTGRLPWAHLAQLPRPFAPLPACQPTPCIKSRGGAGASSRYRHGLPLRPKSAKKSEWKRDSKVPTPTKQYAYTLISLLLSSPISHLASSI